jgi:methionyl-tRNA formyltransferase
MVAQVQEQLAQLQTVRTLVEELCDIGRELLIRRVGK